MATAREQVADFLAHCKQLRAGYTFKFNKKTSSLKHFIRRLEEFPEGQMPKGQTRQNEIDLLNSLALTSPKDKKKYEPAIKSLFAVWGTNKPYVALAENQQGEQIIKYWQTDGNFNDLDQGIGIASRYPGYIDQVRTHLNALYRTATGKIMLDEIAGAHADKGTMIIDHQLSNQCGAMGSTKGMTKIAAQLFQDLTTKLGQPTKTALNKAPLGLFPNKYAWLADKINNTPGYKQKGNPAVNPVDLGITEGMVRDWIENDRSIWEDFPNDDQCNQVKMAVILALYPYDTKGDGTKSSVNYTLGNANPLNVERPPAIGLAHELVHAYYNKKGLQPGFEVENFSTVLFEYLCVGLGPWADQGVCENNIRAEWQSAIGHFDADDVRNRKMIGRRNVYSA